MTQRGAHKLIDQRLGVLRVQHARHLQSGGLVLQDAEGVAQQLKGSGVIGLKRANHRDQRSQRINSPPPGLARIDTELPR